MGLRPGRYLRRRAAPSQEAKGPGVGLGDTIRCASRLAGQCSWGAGLRWVGAQPPLPEWGYMLAGSRDYINRAPWLMTIPGVAIALTVLGFNLLGDGLRSALDPTEKN